MQLTLTVADQTFPLLLHPDRAPKTCAALLNVLPFRSQLIQARWSGESCWVPLGDLDLQLSAENQLHEPKPGQLLFYPKGISETEILVPYGETRFACKFGPLSGNHFATIQADPKTMRALGERVLYEGAKNFEIK